MWQILSLAVVQAFQKDSVNQTEIVVVTKATLVEGACSESYRRPEQVIQIIVRNHTLSILQGRNKMCN